LRFASTSQALLAAGEVDTAIDPHGLHFLYSLHAVVPAPTTIIKGIRKVAPATTLTISKDGTVTENKYWTLHATRPDKNMDAEDWQRAIHEALQAAVKKRLEIADVPVGVLLSGGLDSSLLVALLAEAKVPDIKTFSIGFEDIADEKGSEFEYSDQVVERYQTDHHKIHISNADVLPRLTEAVDNMAEPMFGQDAVAFYLLAEQVSKEVKVVQSGQGADELFGGYFWYPMMNDASGSELDRFAQHYFDRDHTEFLEMVSAAYQGDDYTSDYIAERFSEPDADEFIDKVLRLDVTTLIVDDPVKRVDNMTMAQGLEARVPFLDHQLVELAASMPPQYKLDSGGKHILKKIARGLIPDAVIDRPKGYFPMPALKYVRGEFLDFMHDILTSQSCINRGVFHRSYVEKLLSDPESHFTRIKGSKVWHLALLEYWLQRNVDAA
jgi:asparagine synthase (glutamine-hydrolysing)